MPPRKPRGITVLDPNNAPAAGSLPPEDPPAESDHEDNYPDEADPPEQWQPVQALSQAVDTGDMSVLADARFSEWSWHIFRLRGPDEQGLRESANARIWCDRQTGPLDLATIQAKHGGGLFEIWCKDPRGILRRKFRQAIAGPRKQYNAAEPNVTTTPPPAPGHASSDPLLRILERQGELLEQLIRATNSSSKDKSPSALEVLEVAAKIANMNSPRPAQSANELLDVLKEGMALQAQVAGGGESSTAEKLLEKSLPVIERVLAGMLAPRRPAPRPAPPGTPVPTSVATVVEEPTPEPQAEPVQETHRMTTAVEAFARAIGQGQAPEDFAVTLESILNEQELGLVRMSPAPLLLEQMRKNAGGRLPLLEHENAEPYLAAVLADLNRDDDAGA